MKRAAKAKRKPARAKRPATAKKRVSAIPHGYHTVTPQLTVSGAAEAIDFYKRAFGAKELMRMPSPDGKVMHAELKIGDSVVFVVDEFPHTGPGPCPRSPKSLGGPTGTLHVYVPDVDAAFKRALGAGAQVRMPVMDMFWGDRYGQVTDPFGHIWGLATHKESPTAKQIAKRAEEFFKQSGPQ